MVAGTCWGCLVVAETASLSPVTVFRPYSEEIQSLVSYSPSTGTQSIVSIGRTTHTPPSQPPSGQPFQSVQLQYLGILPFSHQKCSTSIFRDSPIFSSSVQLQYLGMLPYSHPGPQMVGQAMRSLCWAVSVNLPFWSPVCPQSAILARRQFDILNGLSTRHLEWAVNYPS